MSHGCNGRRLDAVHGTEGRCLAAVRRGNTGHRSFHTANGAIGDAESEVDGRPSGSGEGGDRLSGLLAMVCRNIWRCCSGSWAYRFVMLVSCAMAEGWAEAMTVLVLRRRQRRQERAVCTARVMGERVQGGRLHGGLAR